MAVGVLLGSLIVLAFVSASAATLAVLRRAHVLRLAAADRDAVHALEALLGSYRSALVVLRTAAMVAVVASSVLLAASLADDHWAAITGAAAGAAIASALVEISARSLVSQEHVRFFRAMLVPLAIVHAVTRPLTRVAPLSSEAVFPRRAGGRAQPSGVLDELRRLQELARGPLHAGRLDASQEEMIRSIATLTQTAVKEIMVPRHDIDAVSTEAALGDVIDLIVRSGHSRIPLYEGTLDSVVGVLYARDILRVAADPAAGPIDLKRVARPPFFVPETKKAHELLREFLAKSVHTALVVDEYGGVEGIVTLEDVVEEIVGDIQEEFEPGESPIIKLNETEAIVEGQVSLDELNERLGSALAGEGFETVGGFALHHLGRVPKAGDAFEAGGVSMEVVSMAGRRVGKVRVRRLAREPQG